MLKIGEAFACQKTKKKRKKNILLNNTFNIYNLRVLKLFVT